MDGFRRYRSKADRLAAFVVAVLADPATYPKFPAGTFERARFSHSAGFVENIGARSDE